MPKYAVLVSDSLSLAPFTKDHEELVDAESFHKAYLQVRDKYRNLRYIIEEIDEVDSPFDAQESKCSNCAGPSAYRRSGDYFVCKTCAWLLK